MSLQYSRQQQDAFTESGAGFVDLSVAGANQDAVLAGIGLRVRRPCTTLAGDKWSPEFRLNYLHDFNDPQAFIQAAFADAPAVTFRTGSPNVGRDFGQAGAGVTGCLKSDLQFRINFDTQFANGQNAQTADVGLSWQF